MKADLSRRSALNLGVSAAGLLLASCAAPAAAGTKAAAPKPSAPRLSLHAAPNEPGVLPLPFVASELPGLSEKLLSLHHAKNYGGAVSKLSEIYQKLASADPEKAGGYWSEYGTLKAAEASARNSVLLHELYFENLGPNGAPPPAELASALTSRFASLPRLERLLRGCAMATGGWVVLALDRPGLTLEIVQTDGHAGGAWNAEALMVLDMFEHAYALDYGPNKGAYLDAFFRNLRWDVVGARLAAAIA